MVQHADIDHTTITGRVVVQDDGSAVGTAAILNFTNGTTTYSGGTATINLASAAGAANVVVYDEGVNKGTATAGLNIVGLAGSGTVTSGTGIITFASPGYEYSYAQATASVSVTATTEITATTVVTADAVAFDGSTPVLVHFFANDARPDAGAANRQLVFCLYDDTGGGATTVGQIGFTRTEAAANANVPISLWRRLTPSIATHTYSIRAFVSAGTGSVSAGAGGSATAAPAFIRITKV